MVLQENASIAVVVPAEIGVLALRPQRIIDEDGRARLCLLEFAGAKLHLGEIAAGARDPLGFQRHLAVLERFINLPQERRERLREKRYRLAEARRRIGAMLYRLIRGRRRLGQTL